MSKERIKNTAFSLSHNQKQTLNKAGKLLYEMVPVMVGVYLGFVVSNWSERKQSYRESKILIENLISEIEFNQSKIESVIEYHTMLRDSIRKYGRDNHTSGMPQFFEGTRILKLSNSAFTTGLQTGVINELTMNKILSVNQLYNMQNEYNEFGTLMMASLISKDFSDNQEDVKKIARFLAISMTDVVIKESQLIEEFKKVKSLLK